MDLSLPQLQVITEKFWDVKMITIIMFHNAQVSSLSCMIFQPAFCTGTLWDSTSLLQPLYLRSSFLHGGGVSSSVVSLPLLRLHELS